MNLSINCVSFSGKKEVMYGLKRAAVEARSAEVNRSYSFGPRPVSRELDEKRSLGALSAYSDMAVRDSSFITSIQEIQQDKTFMLSLQDLLKPKKLVYGEINPMKKFLNAMIGAAQNTEEGAIQTALQRFVQKISL